MKKLLLFFSIVYFLPCNMDFAFSQNLVPNPSFEDYTLCPNTYYMLPTNWYTCSGDPDYYNACDTTWGFGVPSNGFGFQEAANGRGYCGFFGISFTSYPYAKEYLGCQLKNSLQIGHKYYISFKISRAEWPKLAINNIGLLFSTKSYQNLQPYNIDSLNIPTINFAHVVDTAIIQDSVNWTTISGTVIADSVYQYILIGNFFDSTHTSVIIYNHNNFFQNRSYYYLDEVCVSEDSLTCNVADGIKDNSNFLNKIIVMPNPIYYSAKVILISESEIENITVFDVMGKEVTSELVLTEIIKNKNSSQVIINKGTLSSGIYILKIISGNLIFSNKLLLTN